ncbi:MAG TPA: hypothetical protein VFI53_08385 [Myxococcaceae bacterium]|nr:hypothetical protein [Myxococcaceae bacterium]
MARRAALSTLLRTFQLAVVVFAVALASCGGSKGWSCSWQCNSSGQSGSHTYPDGPDPTSQCEADFGSACNDFTCRCTQ